MKIKLTFIEQEANYADSMRILKEHKLRPLTYQEALANSEELIKDFNGHWSWFWLAEKELEYDGIFTFTADGELVKNTNNASIDHKVRCWPGKQPLSLDVYSDYDARDFGGRFGLDGVYSPNDVARVVIGTSSKTKLAKHKHVYRCECGKMKK